MDTGSLQKSVRRKVNFKSNDWCPYKKRKQRRGEGRKATTLMEAETGGGGGKPRNAGRGPQRLGGGGERSSLRALSGRAALP